MKKDEFESNEAMRQRMLGIENDEEIHGSEAEIKKGNFISNIWYRYKWAIIIISAFIAVFVILIVQMAKKDKNDITIMYAGPKYVTSDIYSSVTGSLTEIMKDYNGDGEKKILFSTITYQTDEQRKESIDDNDIYGKVMSDAANKESLDTFMNQIMSGQVAIYLLDPFFLSDKMYGREFMKVEDVLGYKPDESIMCGETGVYLKKTEFAKYMGGFEDLPDDTVICVLKKLVTTKDDLQKNSIDLFKAILNFGVDE
ncbi:MAG: hypothetical protein ACI3XS_05775 [Eubacteriales bacterium]